MIGPTVNSSLLGALRQLQTNRVEHGKALVKLATGRRINRAADDPAGLITSQQLKAALAALEAQTASLQRTDHVASVADAALGEVATILNDSHALEVQLANSGALSSGEQEAIRMQIDANNQAIDHITQTASFNGQKLFDGSVSLRVGNQTLALPTLSASHLGETEINGQTYSLTDIASAGALANDPAAATQVLDTAIDQIASLRGSIGSFQNHAVASAIKTTRITIENIASANSRIEDTDFAAQTANLIRSRTLDLASIKTLATMIKRQNHIIDLLK